ncbi:alpha/beta fold hydrolase [Tsukamurella sp. 8F]|uniref:thioesterase II family protein n=1 Tax=unclassified Tsukamurella TaxID=2633480 RepID=UPI0023B9D0D6|nr:MULTISPECIES: alpha/beta fold hydrolase [unclassified Tsukamurella]MDF0529492.1 alpha/beta fold hydrolase [Tsukamurella sp. 8J]MDF0585820.1 alpha/beta fold hydrolase [Tsukamurella sp. 8F]
MTSTGERPQTWLRLESRGVERCAGRVVALPHAGAGAASFARWRDLFPAYVDFVRVRLPGREEAAREKPLSSVADAAAGLAAQLARLDHLPTVLYGHSMGALVAFELARSLADLGIPATHLVVSGRRAPHLPASRRLIHTLPEDEFLESLTEIDDAWCRMTDTPEFLRYALDLVRADLTFCESYQYGDGPTLQIPITVCHGGGDPLVDLWEALAWGEHTGGSFGTRIFHGDHFFHQRHRAAISDVLIAGLRDTGATDTDRGCE